MSWPGFLLGFFGMALTLISFIFCVAQDSFWFAGTWLVLFFSTLVGFAVSAGAAASAKDGI